MWLKLMNTSEEILTHNILVIYFIRKKWLLNKIALEVKKLKQVKNIFITCFNRKNDYWSKLWIYESYLNNIVNLDLDLFLYLKKKSIDL